MSKIFKSGNQVVPKRLSVIAIGGVTVKKVIDQKIVLTVSSYEYWPEKKCWTLTFKEIQGKYRADDFEEYNE